MFASVLYFACLVRRVSFMEQLFWCTFGFRGSKDEITKVPLEELLPARAVLNHIDYKTYEGES